MTAQRAAAIPQGPSSVLERSPSAERASMAVYGAKPLRLFSSPGTAPQYQVCNPLKLPMVAIGYSHPDSRVHAPDENVRLDLMPKAAMVLGRFFDEFSRT